MNKKHTYVECQHCKWQLQNFPDKDWFEQPCERCKNTRQVPNPQEILCNLCGECMCPPPGTMNEQIPHGLYQASVTGGYDSYHLLDMTTYTFNFCEKCLRQLFIQCKIKPNVYNSFKPPDEDPWKEDQKYYEYRVWKDTGGHHQAYLNKKCNAVKGCPNDAVYTRLHNEDFDENCCCEEHKETRAYGNSSLVPFISNNLKSFL